jgi:hypothetical protein
MGAAIVVGVALALAVVYSFCMFLAGANKSRR